jgi:hypothetical protein
MIGVLLLVLICRTDWKSVVSEAQDMFSGRPARFVRRFIRIVGHGTCNNFALGVTFFRMLFISIRVGIYG